VIRFSKLIKKSNPPPELESGLRYESSLLYVASHCLPRHANGYSIRTHEILVSLKKSGIKNHTLTRPGYPRDRDDFRSDSMAETHVDGICYHHINSLGRHWPTFIYAHFAAKKIASFARKRKIKLIHAASNHTNALPALIAAEQLGIPFQYEVRGFWELSKAAVRPEFQDSFRFRRGLRLERLVALRSNRIFAISEQVALYIREHFGIPPEKIVFLPNCVDEAILQAPIAKPLEANTIAYTGTLNDYEGIDLLIHACAQLRACGKPYVLKIAGDGPESFNLQRLAGELEMQESVFFLGKLSQKDSRHLLAQSAVVCIPRKPVEVCRLVPPMKLVEAMALGKPVIVPDLPVFRDELGPDFSDLFFKAGSSESLAQVLDAALSQPAKLIELGRLAREKVSKFRVWSQHLPKIWMGAAGPMPSSDYP
jgi:glycosyltransferase involved in cell wall biosynthesis